MKSKFSNPWRWWGTISRGEFFVWGLLLFALKFNLDRLLNVIFFGQRWSFFDWEHLRLYVWQVVPTKAEEPRFLAMLALALPFLWAGVALILRRLRAVGGHPLWVILFFVPVFKLVFFAILCLWPERQETTEEASKGTNKRGRWADHIIPSSSRGSACFGIGISLVLMVACVSLGTTVLQQYGWSLFVGLPFLGPLLAVLIHCFHERRTLRSCLWVANLTIALAGLALLAFAMEGAICLIMAAPLGFGVASAAGVTAYWIHKTLHGPEDCSKMMCVVLLSVPALLGVERALPPPVPLLAVKSCLVVDAPPERVWRHVVTFAELPPARELIFRLGVAYPQRAEIQGRGVGAVRQCQFSTGPFIEPIEVWDEPKLLKFSVIHNPEPMQEWTPYRYVHPPHLDGYLESKGGQFRLELLEDGRTLLEGTTWYHHHLWPARYWQVWSDYIIHTIHLRVLKHVKQLAEEPAP